MFETGAANAWLMRLYGSSTLEPITNSLCYVIYKTLPNNTDFTIFKAASYQGFNLAFIGDVAHYHTPLDNFDNASPSTMQHQGANALSALLALANATDLNPPAADSVFFDVFARGVIVWPIGVRVAGGDRCAAILLAAAILLSPPRPLERASGRVSVSSARSPMCCSGRRACSVGVLALLRILGRLPPIQGASLDRAPAGDAHRIRGVGLADDDRNRAPGSARRAGFWGFWFGGSTLAAILSLAAAVIMPGRRLCRCCWRPWRRRSRFAPCVWASHQGPRAIARSRGLRRALSRPRRLCGRCCRCCCCCTRRSELRRGPSVRLTLCLTAGFLLPLLGNATRLARERLAVIAAAIATFGAICITVLLPTYSAALAAAGEHRILARCRQRPRPLVDASRLAAPAARDGRGAEIRSRAARALPRVSRCKDFRRSARLEVGARRS